MKAKIRVVLLLLSVLMLCVNFSSNRVVKAQNMERLAPYEAMIAIEGNTGTVLYSYREHDRLAMASTTKIVTAILAIENCNDLDTKFRVSDRAIGIEGTSMYLKEGEYLCYGRSKIICTGYSPSQNSYIKPYADKDHY